MILVLYLDDILIIGKPCQEHWMVKKIVGKLFWDVRSRLAWEVPRPTMFSFNDMHFNVTKNIQIRHVEIGYM